MQQFFVLPFDWETRSWWKPYTTSTSILRLAQRKRRWLKLNILWNVCVSHSTISGRMCNAATDAQQPYTLLLDVKMLRNSAGIILYEILWYWMILSDSFLQHNFYFAYFPIRFIPLFWIKCCADSNNLILFFKSKYLLIHDIFGSVSGSRNRCSSCWEKPYTHNFFPTISWLFLFDAACCFFFFFLSDLLNWKRWTAAAD